MPGKGSESVVVFKGECIHVMHPPGFEITPESVPEAWERLIEACARFQCNKVLVEGQAPKRNLSLSDTFASGKTLSDRRQFGIRVAFHFTDFTIDEKSSFLEAVTANRATPVRFFSTREGALA